MSSPGFGEPKLRRWDLWALWIGVLVGPLSWLMSLEVAYALSYGACRHTSTWFVHVAVLAPMVLIALAALWVYRLPSLADVRPDQSWPHWLRHAALGLCAFFAVVVIATDIPVWLLPLCR